MPESLAEDLEQLRQLTEQYQRGEISAARYQAFRVPQGVYEQRESGTFMLRARLAAGILKPAQMRVAAEVADAYGDGTLHLTSRQDLQVHGVKVEGIYPAVARLTEAGLSTKGGGGNTVRNIAACYLAGVCPNEAFDVTSHVVKLTESLLPDPLSFQLPRKYKIACSGCGLDCAGATINDLGFIAKQQDGEDGFTVYAGGGMGANSRVGTLLEEFIPAEQASKVADAVKRVFDKHGNRKNRHRARLRFLVEDIGIDAFKELYQAELGGPVGKPLKAEAQRLLPPLTSQLLPQKQAGYYSVEIAPPNGLIQASRLRLLARIIERYGDKTLRATNWQTVFLRWVPYDHLALLHAELAGAGVGDEVPAVIRHLVACAGASTCRLGIGLARGLAGAIREALLTSDLNLFGATGDLTIHVSGCPNACGRHPAGQIGLFGAARRVHGHLVPHYVVQFGGHVEEGNTVLASGALTIPARSIPAFLVEFLQSFEQSERYPGFAAYLEAGGRQVAKELGRKHASVPEFEEDKNYYFDWGAQETFSLAGRGPGECGAGVFDLIRVDLDNASEALETGRLLSATVSAARALLVTKGEQADSDFQSLQLFRRHFIAPGVVSPTFQRLIDRAEEALSAGEAETEFDSEREGVASLLRAVQELYQGLGPSLRLPTTPCAMPLTAK